MRESRDRSEEARAALPLRERGGALESPRAALRVIREVTDALVAEGDLDHQLESIVTSTVLLLGARRGSVMLLDSEARELRIRAAVGVAADVIEHARLQLGEGLAGRCAARGEPILLHHIRDWLPEERLREREEREYRNPSAVCVPLRVHDRTLGVLNINDRQDGCDFTPDDLFVAEIIANQAAVAIEGAELRDAAAGAAAAHRALALAREIQQSFLPCDRQLGRLSAAARSLPCEGAGGDYVDFWSPARCSRTLCVAAGDVAGHGVGAALIVAGVRASLRGLLEAQDALDAVLTAQNALLIPDLRRGHFVTLMLCAIDPTTGELRYASAGHDPGLLWRAGSGKLEELPATGPPLGILEEACFPEEHLQLEPGDRLLLGTDGLWEIRDGAGLAFGRERLAQCLCELANLPPDALADALVARVTAHAGARPAADDLSVVALTLSPA